MFIFGWPGKWGGLTGWQQGSAPHGSARDERPRNILTKLDQRVPTRFYWQLTLLATLGGFLFGYDTSNIGSALNFVPYHLQGLALGYLVSGASLGAAAGRS